MNKNDEKIMKKIPKNKIGIACFNYKIQGTYEKILNDLKEIDSTFDSKLEIVYEHGKEIKETIVFFHRNEKTRLCVTFGVDEDREKFILYYPYYSEAYSLCDDSDTRKVFRGYGINEYYDLLELIKNILENPESNEIVRVTSKGIIAKIKIEEK